MAEQVGSLYYELDLDDSRLTRSLDAADRKVSKFGNQVSNHWDDAASSSNQSLTRLNNTFDGVGAAATRFGFAAGAAAGVAGVASVKMAGDFEQSLNILGSVTQATDEQMRQLSDTARQLGKDAALPGISAKDAAAAMTELGKAGLGVNDIMSASKGVLSLAKAGQIEVGLAATVTARALNAFGLEGKEATRIADLLSAGANGSTASVEDMAMGLQQAGASSKAMGVSLEDTVTALAIFSNAGINGSDAGTSLKTMFQQLANPTKESASLMRQLGLDFFDAQGKFVGLEQTAGMLQDKLGSLSAEQRNQALATIFGSDASRVANVLADTGAQKFGEMGDAVNKAGAATDLAAAQNSGFNGALDNLISTLETVGTDLGTKVLPPLTEFIKVVGTQAPPAIQWMIDNFPTLAAVITGVVVAIAAMKVVQFAADLRTVGFAATGLGQVFTLLAAHPIILIIAALAAALVYLQLKFNILGESVQFFTAVWSGISEFFVNLFNGILSWLQTNWPYVLGILMGPFGLAVAYMYTHRDQMLAIFRAIPGALGAIFGAVVGIITNPFRSAFNGVVSLWNNSIGRLNFSVPGWVPGIGGRGWTMPKLPFLATGAVVTGPTMAMIGEAGTEAVLPLSQLDRYSTLFSRIEDMARGNNSPQSVKGGDTYVNIGTVQDRSDAEFIIAQLNRNSELESMGLSPMSTGGVA